MNEIQYKNVGFDVPMNETGIYYDVIAYTKNDMPVIVGSITNKNEFTTFREEFISEVNDRSWWQQPDGSIKIEMVERKGHPAGGGK